MTLLDDTRTTRRTDSTRRTDTTRTERPTRSRAAQRAIDRRAKRILDEQRPEDQAPRRGRTTPRNTGSLGSTSGSRLSDRLRRVPFVVPVLMLLVIGLGLSLWLSTKAAQDSYLLGVARKENQALMDHRDSLKRAYESGDAAPGLSDKASRNGMVPAQNPARMVIGPDGKPRIIGDPTPATGTRMGTINPENTPDPTATIDTNKVEDSLGLPGTGNRSSAPTTTPGVPSANTPAGQTPAGQTPAPTPNAPTPTAVAPNPNVLPQTTTPTSNPPGATSPQTR